MFPPPQCLLECCYGLLGHIHQFRFFQHLMQPQKVECRDRVAVWLGAILALFHPQHYGGIAFCGSKVTFASRIPKLGILPLLQFQRSLEVTYVECHLVQVDQGSDCVGIVIHKPANQRIIKHLLLYLQSTLKIRISTNTKVTCQCEK